MGAGCTVDNTISTNTSTTNDVVVDDAMEEGASLWAAGVAQGDIASTDIAGTINDEAVEIAQVQVDFDGEEYNWSFSDTEFNGVCGFASDNNEVSLRTKDLQVGTFTKGLDTDVEFSDYHSYYYYEQADGSPYSVNTDWEADIVVTGITRGLSEGTFGESVGTVTGFGHISFGNGLTEIDGAFEAEFCEDAE